MEQGEKKVGGWFRERVRGGKDGYENGGEEEGGHVFNYL